MTPSPPSVLYFVCEFVHVREMYLFSPVFVSLWIHFLYFTISGLFRFLFFLMQSHFSLFKKKKSSINYPSFMKRKFIIGGISILRGACFCTELFFFTFFFVFCNCVNLQQCLCSNAKCVNVKKTNTLLYKIKFKNLKYFLGKGKNKRMFLSRFVFCFQSHPCWTEGLFLQLVTAPYNCLIHSLKY